MIITESMRRDWERRAKENAYYWVASSNKNWSKDDYYLQGEGVVNQFAISYLKKKLPKDQWKDINALDIGCGTGRLTRALAKLCRHVIGVDISQEMIKLAKQDNSNVKNATFIVNSGVDLNVIESNSIDFCFSFIVFQHIPSKTTIHTYFEEILRVLKPGGFAKFQVRGYPGNPPGKVIWFNGFNNFYITLTCWRGFVPLLWWRKYNTLYGACFTQTELEVILAEAGFRDISAYHENLHYLWAEVSKPNELNQ